LGAQEQAGSGARKWQVWVEEAATVGGRGAQWRAEAESGNFEAGYGVELIEFRESLTNGEPAGKFLDGD
jgi:hypothetical protein